jgi:predicted phosphate transport protein (TIGR00153 family)
MYEAFVSFPGDDAPAARLRDVERNGDRLTRELYVLLESALVSPIDREDAFALASALDDVVDHLDEAVDELALYGVRSVVPAAIEQAAVARDACALLASAVGRLDGFRDARDLLARIEELEHAGDRVERSAISSLFAGGADALMVIRWKDIHEEIESAINACDRAGRALGTIYLKNR